MPGTVTETADSGLNPICNLFQPNSFWLLTSTRNANAKQRKISKVPDIISTYKQMTWQIKHFDDLRLKCLINVLGQPRGYE
jgi:hypothetical protein